MRRQKIEATVASYKKTYFILIVLTIVFFSSLSVISLAKAEKIEIHLEDRVIEADEKFSVYVINESGYGVEGVTLFIESAGPAPVDTNEDGYTSLTAPSEPGEYRIIAQKDGTIVDNLTIEVVAPPPLWESPYFPIAIAVIVLIGAIFFVNWREKNQIYSRAKEITNEKNLEEFKLESSKNSTNNEAKKIRKGSSFKIHDELSSQDSKPVVSKTSDNPKVEEIRIRRPNKKKEIVKVDEEKEPVDKVLDEKKVKKRDYDWFAGKDDVRYEIDKITGEIDEEGKDKWFEGVEDLKEKIDKRVKKKDKKEEEDEEED